MGVLWGMGRERRDGDPQGLVHAHVRNPEKYSDCRTDLIGGGGRGGCTCYIFHKDVYRGGHGLSPKHTN